MPLFGRDDKSVTANSTTTAESTTGAPIGTYALVMKGGGANAHFGNTSTGSRAATDATMFGNVTSGAFVNGMVVGVFGADATETGVGMATGNLVSGVITYAGSGYGANAVVTLTAADSSTNTTAANAQANTSTGKIIALNISLPGSTWRGAPTVAIAAPAAINITANTTGVSNTADVLLVTSANSKFAVGDRLYYAVPAGNTAVGGLTGNSYYYVTFANSTALAISNTSGGANADITENRTGTAEVHTIRGDTAEGYVTIQGAGKQGVAHAGWQLRKVGTGSITQISYTGTATDYSNTDVITVASPAAGGNATASISTNSTGGALVITIDNAGFGFTAVNATANVSIANSTGGASGGSGATFTAVAGGRAGRVTYETLVAMGSLGAQTAAYGTAATVADASDDTVFPDA